MGEYIKGNPVAINLHNYCVSQFDVSKFGSANFVDDKPYYHNL